jgi:hypothetical protein
MASWCLWDSAVLQFILGGFEKNGGVFAWFALSAIGLGY